jgi:hypothetical protein
MNRTLMAVLLLAAFTGCSHKEETGTAQQPVAASAKGAAPAARRTLAYQHHVDVDVPDDKVAQVFEAGQAACRALVTEQCTIMQAQLSGSASDQAASASLTIRALPAAIPKLLATFATRGEITRQSTRAEELSGPLEDQAKKLALLKDYRDKLEGLRTRAANDIDSLIKVNHELAQVQGELEAATGAQAALQRRVDTELLEVKITSQRHQAFWRPIGQAADQFGTSLSQGTAIAISATAYLIPWILLLSLAIWIGRKLWRRRK